MLTERFPPHVPRSASSRAARRLGRFGARAALVAGLAAVFVLASLAVLVTPAMAQDDREMSEQERRRAAREEQEEARRAAEAAEEQARLSEEEQLERERLAALGAEGVELLEDRRGFFVRVEAFHADPSGGDRPIARLGEIETSATTAEELDTDGDGLPDAFSVVDERLLTLEYDAEVSPRLELGWGFGGGSALSVRWWSWSASASLAAQSERVFESSGGDPPLILGGIDNAGVEIGPDFDRSGLSRPFGWPGFIADAGAHGASAVSASGDLEAERLDLLYRRVGLARRTFVLDWLVGLTLGGVERAETAEFTWRSFSQGQVGNELLSRETVSAVSDTSGFGVTVGGGARWHFGEERRWAFRVGAELTGFSAEPELRFIDEDVLTDAVLDPRERQFQDVTSESGDELVTILEGDVAVEGRIGERLRLSLGYRHASWLDAITEQSFPSAVSGAQLVEATNDIDFSGPYVRLGFHF